MYLKKRDVTSNNLKNLFPGASRVRSSETFLVRLTKKHFPSEVGGKIQSWVRSTERWNHLVTVFWQISHFILLFCCVVLLVYSCVDVLLYCCNVILLFSCFVVLVYSRDDVLLYCCVGVYCYQFWSFCTSSRNIWHNSCCNIDQFLHMSQGAFETTAAHENTKQETLTNNGIL